MKVKVVSQDSPKLLDRMRAEIRVRHYSIRTEEAYLDWARRFKEMPGSRFVASSIQHPALFNKEVNSPKCYHAKSELNLRPFSSHSPFDFILVLAA